MPLSSRRVGLESSARSVMLPARSARRWLLLLARAGCARRCGSAVCRAGEPGRGLDGPLPRGSARPGPRDRAQRLLRPPGQRGGADVRRQLGRGADDGARAPVPALHHAVPVPRPAAVPGMGGAAAGFAGVPGDQVLHRYLPAVAHDLDGRPPAPSRVRAPYVHGVLDRRMERRRPHRDHHAHQGGLLPPQRHPQQRSHDAGGALHPPRQRAVARDHRHRPGVPDRALHPQPGIRSDGT